MFIRIGIICLAVLFSTVALAAPNLPHRDVRIKFKDKPYKEAIEILVSQTSLSVQFAKDLELDKKVSIDVESMNWDVVFTSVLEAYKMGYRFLSDKKIEVFKKD